jgi:cell wall assembly regulator SMI1
MDYRKTYDELVQQLLQRKLERSDGISAAEIDRHERKLGFSLPKAVRDYYQAAGKLNELNKAHNRLLDLDQIATDGDYVVFMEENQQVVHWGFKQSDANPDPEVWQRVNSETPGWYSEEMTFSQFIVHDYRLQAGIAEE